MSSVDRSARRTARIERGLLNAQVKPRLPHSSIDNGALVIRDINGDDRAIIGQQYDGSSTAASVGGPPLPSPTTPGVTPMPGGLALYWDGTWVDGSPARMDFQRVTFHAVTDVDDFDAVASSQIVGEITIATGGEIFASLPPVEHFVFAVAWSEAGKFSVESDVAFGTPLNIVDQEQFDAINDDVEAAMAAAAAAPAVYRQPTMPAHIDGKKAIWYDTDDGNVTWYDDGTAGFVKQQVGAGAIATNAVTAGTVAAGALDAFTITGPLIQTTSTIARGIKLVSNTLVAYDAAGAGTFALDGLTGAVSMVGPLISGGTITGTGFQTSATAARGIKVVGSVLTAYDSAGNARATINGSTGEVTLVGKMRTGLAGTKRVEVGQNAGDASAVEFYSGIVGELTPSLVSAVSFGGTGGTSQALLMLSGPTFLSTDSVGSVYIQRKSNGTSSLTLFGDLVESSGKTLSLANSTTISGTQYNSVVIGSGSALALVTNTGTSFPTPGTVGAAGEITVRARNAARIESTVEDVILTPQAAKRVVISSGTGITLQTAHRVYTGSAINPKVNVEDWVSPTLLNSWTNADPATYSTPGYKLSNNRVTLRGTVARAVAPPANSVLFVLPSNMRPSRVKTFSVRGDHSTGAVAVQVDAVGNVYCTGTPLFYWLDQVSFDLD